MHSDVWTYSDSSQLGTNIADVDITGFEAEALNGSIGQIDEATYESDATRPSYVIVDTGPWIFGKKVMLPAGIIRSVDTDDERVFVNRTKEEIKNAPEFDDSLRDDTSYRSQLGSYYGPGGSADHQFDDGF